MKPMFLYANQLVITPILNALTSNSIHPQHSISTYWFLCLYFAFHLYIKYTRRGKILCLALWITNKKNEQLLTNLYYCRFSMQTFFTNCYLSFIDAKQNNKLFLIKYLPYPFLIWVLFTSICTHACGGSGKSIYKSYFNSNVEIKAQYGIAKNWNTPFFFAVTCSNVRNNNFTFAIRWTAFQINNWSIYRGTIVSLFLYFLIPRLARARLCKQAV